MHLHDTKIISSSIFMYMDTGYQYKLLSGMTVVSNCNILNSIPSKTRFNLDVSAEEQRLCQPDRLTRVISRINLSILVKHWNFSVKEARIIEEGSSSLY